MKVALPRVVSIKQGLQTTLTGEKNGYLTSVATEARSMLTDHEVLILLLWAILSPLAALAYVVWNKYDKLKWLAIPLIIAAVIQFAGLWGSLFLLLKEFGFMFPRI